ncbi:methyltransferase domain-containing protein [Actinopolymorpha sp. B17G11]|uniref:methyltransferase domain-containing protein n=1 Tax=Actinopolymorpha sp. B17G11 TaxID=3160861 RepID=UPI0032E45D50
MPECGRSADGSDPRAQRGEAASGAGHRRAVRSEVVWRLVRTILAEQSAVAGHAQLDVVDAGGGTGHLAVPLAELGHRVTVVDPSPDSLAALKRRADEAAVTGSVQAVQGDVTDLPELVGAAGADLVLCHSVLEVVDDPGAALESMAAVLRPGAALSLVAANRYAVVLAKVIGGHLSDARAVLAEPADGWQPEGPTPRRFTATQLRRAVGNVGLVVLAEHGVRVFADLAPATLADEPSAAAALLELEATAAEHPTFRAIATQIHLLARRV